MTKRLSILLALTALAAAPAPAEFDDAGYRSSRYRAPVTLDPRPAARLALPAALTLTPGRDALFLDVMPAEGGVRDAVTGQWRLATPHETIPGAEWHPEAGRSPVDPAIWHGLERAVARARVGNPKRPVVLFCRTDCWMGWNAARRLARGGLDNIWWLAEGTDGWHSTGHALVEARPVTVPGLEPQRRRNDPWQP